MADNKKKDQQPAQQPQAQEEVTQQQNTALPGGRYRRPDGTIVDANNVPVKDEQQQGDEQPTQGGEQPTQEGQA
jgi:hypothetical protein